MTTNHMINVCRIGQHEKTCAYLSANTDGFICAKLWPRVKAVIDQRLKANTLGAQGDNCTIDPDPTNVPPLSTLSLVRSAGYVN